MTAARSILRRTSLAVVLAVTAPLAFAGPAFAAELVMNDARGDVWQMDMESEAEELIPAPRAVAADVLRSTVKHTDTHVIVRQRFADLRKRSFATVISIDVRTRLVPRRQIGIIADSGIPEGEVIQPARPWTGIKARFDYDRDVMVTRIPREFLGNPRWVQVRLNSAVLTGGLTTLRFLTDNPHDDQGEFRGWSSRVLKG